jgi:hypothetical protein
VEWEREAVALSDLRSAEPVNPQGFCIALNSATSAPPWAEGRQLLLKERKNEHVIFSY